MQFLKIISLIVAGMVLMAALYSGYNVVTQVAKNTNYIISLDKYLNEQAQQKDVKPEKIK